MTKPTAEEILSLFEDPLVAAMIDGVIETPQGDVLYEGPRLTVQYIANWFDVSDGTARRAVRALEKRGLVLITSVLDPANNHRRLMITPTKQRGANWPATVRISNR